MERLEELIKQRSSQTSISDEMEIEEMWYCKDLFIHFAQYLISCSQINLLNFFMESGN